MSLIIDVPFAEKDEATPFFIDSIEKVKQLKLYKVHLKNDFITDLDISLSSNDYMIDEYAQKFNF